MTKRLWFLGIALMLLIFAASAVAGPTPTVPAVNMRGDGFSSGQDDLTHGDYGLGFINGDDDFDHRPPPVPPIGRSDPKKNKRATWADLWGWLWRW
jgi:hypothetical protein